MKVTELSETALIDLISGLVATPKDKQLLMDIGDDAAAWQGDTAIQLATVDSLIQNVHFSLDNASWGDLGWKALAVNLSDIAAMGGIPRYALVALALPPDTEVEQAADLYRGMMELARQHHVRIIGGDTDCAPLLTISVTVLGIATGKDMLTRSSAKPGDRIAVTGALGGAAGGLKMLSGLAKLAPPDASALRNAFYRPVPRVNEGQLLVKNGVKTGIDVSDGLVRDLGHICMASRLSAKVEVARVPINPAVKASFGGDALKMALSGGEDYELLFTAGDAVIAKAAKALSCPVTVIGEITAGSPGTVNLIGEYGKPFPLERAGWDHFAGR